MKNNAKYLISSFLMMLLVAFLPFTCWADLYLKTDSTGLASGVFTPRLIADLGNIPYFVSVSYQFDAYEDTARLGIESWNTTNGNIKFVETSVYYNSACDVKGYWSNTSDTEQHVNASGFTRLWIGEGVGTGNNTYYDSADSIECDYYVAEIYIHFIPYPDNPDSAGIPATNTDMVRSTVAHEAGHALGLGHVSGSQYIMHQGYSSRTTLIPTTSEKNAVISLYSYRETVPYS